MSISPQVVRVHGLGHHRRCDSHLPLRNGSTVALVLQVISHVPNTLGFSTCAGSTLVFRWVFIREGDLGVHTSSTWGFSCMFLPPCQLPQRAWCTSATPLAELHDLLDVQQIFFWNSGPKYWLAPQQGRTIRLPNGSMASLFCVVHRHLLTFQLITFQLIIFASCFLHIR